MESKQHRDWLIACVGRGPAIVVGALFSNAALTFLAERLDEDCDGTVDLGFFQLRISSILAAGQVLENLFNIFLGPLFGTLADASSHRKGFLVLTSVMWSGGVLVGGFLLLLPPSLTTLWLYFLSLLMALLFYEPAFLLLFAYLPELGASNEGISRLVSVQYSLLYGVQLGTAIILSALSLVLENVFSNELIMPAIAHFYAFAWFLCFGANGIRLLPSRQQPRESRTSFCTMVKGQIARLLSMPKQNPMLTRFFLAWTFFYAGNTAITVLQIAYVIEEFDFQVADIAVLGALLLIFATIGAFLSEGLAKRFPLKHLLLAIVTAFAIGTFTTPIFLRGEDKTVVNSSDATAAGCLVDIVTSRQPTPLSGVLVYLVAILNGLGTGMLLTLNQTLFAQIVPGGEEATFFGFKTFFSKSLTWAPALLFAVLNEATGNLQLAFASLGFWFLMALPFLASFDAKEALEEVAHTLDRRAGWETEDSSEVEEAPQEVEKVILS